LRNYTEEFNNNLWILKKPLLEFLKGGGKTLNIFERILLDDSGHNRSKFNKYAANQDVQLQKEKQSSRKWCRGSVTAPMLIIGHTHLAMFLSTVLNHVK
jgi:hypothetical protein